ncbi:MAG: aminotransferase class I/II-fold pyridoxal phosphate-dependent enzyme [Streptosporangiaceae bacterium]
MLAKIDLIVGTFSKSLASVGGFVAGPRASIDYIRHRANAMVFSASMAPACVAAAHAALRIIDAEPDRRALTPETLDARRTSASHTNGEARRSRTPRRLHS